MAVRLTESRIPGGFGAADRLGENVASSDGHYVLISHLSAPLRSEPSLLPLRNRYVVFVDTAAVAAPADYQWVFEFFGADPLNPIHTTPARVTEHGVCFLVAQDIPEIFDVALTRVIVTVTMDGVPDPLVMDQSIVGLFEDIEELITSDAPQSIARAGNPRATRTVANRYRAYITESDSPDPLTGIPTNLTAAIAYLNSMRFTEEASELQADAWETYVNEAGEETDVPRTPLGLTQVRPFVLSMFVSATATTPGSIAVETWATGEAHAAFESRRARAFHALAATARADYVNLLRFPKSALRTTRVLLDELQTRRPEWAGLPRAALVENRECVEVLTSESQLGPFSGAPSLTAVGKDVFHKMFTPFIQVIVESSYLPFEIVKVLVVDVRSGQPVSNARVKQITITSATSAGPQEHVLATDFDANSAPTTATQALSLQAQHALERLGYDVNGPSTNFGDVGRQRYKEYWDHRVVDGSVAAVTAGNPPAYMLRLIVDEYNAHRATNASGVLALRIPRILLDGRRLSVEVGFWHLPVLLEALGDDDQALRRADGADGGADGGLTGFSISWVGPQDLDWNANVAGTANMGWRVAGGGRTANLQSALRLVLKENEDAFTRLDAARLSRFYQSSGFHLVLIAMKWCQPVWDEFDDSAAALAGATTEDTYIQDARYRGFRMHLITYPYGGSGSDLYGGKGTGKVEDRPNPRWRNRVGVDHAGLDVHARVGDRIFALTGGRVTSVDVVPNLDDGTPDPNWIGHVSVAVRFGAPPNARDDYAYLHLTSRLVAVNDQVMAGQVLGLGGRTGNLGIKSIFSGHVHINTGVIAPEGVHLRSTPDAANQIVIPNNDYPLVLPCSCQVTQQMSLTEAQISALTATEAGRQQLATRPPTPRPANVDYAYIDCRFHNNAEVANRCWAAAELRCPHIDPADRGVIKLQVQLRHLNEVGVTVDGFAHDNHPEYLHPGTADAQPTGVTGNAGPIPGNVAVAGLVLGTHVIRLDSRHNGRLIQVRHTQPDGSQVTGWMASNLLDANDNLSVASLDTLIDANVQATRMAIYVFREHNGLLRVNNGAHTDYRSNFDMDDAAWARLNQLAPISAPV